MNYSKNFAFNSFVGDTTFPFAKPFVAIFCNIIVIVLLKEVGKTENSEVIK
jgi:hypothetical protein